MSVGNALISCAENWHVFSVDLETEIVRDMTPFQGIRSDAMFTSKADPDSILVGLNLLSRSVFDMYRYVCLASISLSIRLSLSAYAASRRTEPKNKPPSELA